MSIPALPIELTDHKFSDGDLAELWHKMIAELLNAEYSGRTHENRRTYNAGCKGPLCTKAAREHTRRRMDGAPSLKYAYIDRILDAWKPIAQARISNAQQKLLEELTAS